MEKLIFRRERHGTFDFCERNLRECFGELRDKQKSFARVAWPVVDEAERQFLDEVRDLSFKHHRTFDEACDYLVSKKPMLFWLSRAQRYATDDDNLQIGVED